VQKNRSEIIRAARLENEKRLQTKKQGKMPTGEPDFTEPRHAIAPRDGHTPSLSNSANAVLQYETLDGAMNK